MEIIKITIIGITAAILSVLIKKYNPELSMLIGLVTGVVIMLSVIPQLKSVLDIIYNLYQAVNLDKIYLSIVLKMIAVAYIAEFGVQVCKDAGEGAIASKIEFAGKIIIIIISAPILTALLKLILTIMPV